MLLTRKKLVAIMAATGLIFNAAFAEDSVPSSAASSVTTDTESFESEDFETDEFGSDDFETEDFETEDFETEDFSDSGFDDLEFASESSPENSKLSFLKDVSLEISHSVGANKLSDWQWTTNATTGVLGWSASILPNLYAEFEGQVDLYWADDLRTGADGFDEEDYQASINAAFVQTSMGNASVKAGYYTIGWGEVEGSGTLDVINPSASIASGSMDISGDAQLFIGTDLFFGQNTLSTFVTLLPEAAEIPGIDLAENNAVELGAQLKASLSGSDVSLYTGYLRTNTPVLNTVSFEAQANHYSLYGFSANRSFGKVLAKFDVAYKNDLEIVDVAEVTGPVNISRLDYAVGFEIGFNGGQQLVVSLSNQQILDFKPSYVVVPFPVPMAAKEHSGRAMLNYTDSFMNEDLSLTAGSMASLDGEMLMLFSQVSYQMNDRWKFSGGGLMAWADTESLFAGFNEEVQLNAGVTWSN